MTMSSATTPTSTTMTCVNIDSKKTRTKNYDNDNDGGRGGREMVNMCENFWSPGQATNWDCQCHLLVMMILTRVMMMLPHDFWCKFLLSQNFQVELKFLKFHPKRILNIKESIEPNKLMKIKIWSFILEPVWRMVVDDDDGGDDDDDNDDDDDDDEDANRKAMNGVRTKAEWLRADTHTLFSTEVEWWWSWSSSRWNWRIVEIVKRNIAGT